MFRAIFFIILIFSELFSLNIESIVKNIPKNVEGNFTQIKKLIDFENEIKSSGEFSIKNSVLVWKVTNPIVSTIRIDKSGIWTLLDGKFEKINNANNLDMFLDILNLNIENLKQEFELIVDGDINSWQVELSPKGVILKEIFKKIHIKGSNSIKMVELIEKNGDTTINLFDVR